MYNCINQVPQFLMRKQGSSKDVYIDIYRCLEMFRLLLLVWFRHRAQTCLELNC